MIGVLPKPVAVGTGDDVFVVEVFDEDGGGLLRVKGAGNDDVVVVMVVFKSEFGSRRRLTRFNDLFLFKTLYLSGVPGGAIRIPPTWT